MLLSIINRTWLCKLYMLYTHLQHHNDTIIKMHEGRFLYKYIYLSLYCKGLKRIMHGLCVRGSWRPNRNCNILTLTLMAVMLCLSCSPDAQPEVQWPTLLGDGFLYCILSATSLVSNSIGVPEGPLGRVWLSLPQLVSLRLELELNCSSTVVLTALYNSSTPTRCLKSHV